MSGSKRFLAIDLGAESGRGVVGTFDGSVLALDEVVRFPNIPVQLGGTLYWDFLRLYGDVQLAIDKARGDGDLASVGVDGWGVDFGLLDPRGRLLSNPVHYRDERTRGALEQLLGRVSRDEIYRATGIQFMEINTLVQLYAMRLASDPELERASRLLLIPDLINHFLCGSDVIEYTNATTTQCFGLNGDWATELLARVDVPRQLFPDVVAPGTCVGTHDRVAVVAPGTHDTASAVAGTPLKQDTAFLSSGTWSLLGFEVDDPIVNDRALAANLTNEGGVGGKIRLLRNIMGLWLMQEARRALGGSYDELTALAESAPPFSAFVDPDDERFLRPGALPRVVSEYCRETDQAVPNDTGTLVRVLLESLALKYAWVMRQLECVTGRRIGAIRVVGGGSQNALLCRLTANACGVPVFAGPAEATAIGNIVVQAIAAGEVGSLAEARPLVDRSFPAQCYEPAGDWSEARARFDALLQVGHTGGN